ncbi:MAG: ribosome maturation factor RimM [Pseudomonadota bacterium]
MTAERICLGALAGAFGTRGEVRLKSFTAAPEDVAAYGPLETEDGTRRFAVTLTGTAKTALTARLSGVTTKEAADALRGTRLYVDRALLPDTDEDEYYHADLIGLDVYDTGGALLGRINAVMNHGASDLLEITGPDLTAPILLPFTKATVPTVDLRRGRLVADLPEGLL